MSEESGTEGAELRPAGAMADMFDGTFSPYRDPRGRKKMRITNELRNRVAMLRAAGMTQEQIADAVGCSVPTLAQYFSLELNEGKSAKRAEMIDARWKRRDRRQCHGDEGLVGAERSGHLARSHRQTEGGAEAGQEGAGFG